MALNPLVSVNVALQAGSVSRAGFGTPLFAAKHRYFPERTRSYTSMVGVSEDVPTTSNPYIALQGIFGQTPSVASAMIGRIEADQILAPVGVADGSVHSVTVVAGTGDAVTASFTAGAADDEEAVVDALKAAIDADPEVSPVVTTTKNGTGAATTLTIAATDAASGDVFYTPFEQIIGLADTYTSTESAADVLSNIQEENNDWYFMMTEDHSETFVLGMAAAIEATGNKLYFVSTDQASALTTLSASPADIAGKLEDLNYSRTAHIWHQDADTAFVEARFVGKNAPFDAGSVTWANVQLSGVTPSKQANGNLLTGTQKNNLEARNSNFIDDYRTVSIVRLGRLASGEYIDVIRGMDWQIEEITVNMSNLLINQAGGKVTFDNQGINRVKSNLTTSLQRGVDRNFIQEGFKVFVPDAANVSVADKAARILNDVTFEATLSGAIHDVVISGSLSL